MIAVNQKSEIRYRILANRPGYGPGYRPVLDRGPVPGPLLGPVFGTKTGLGRTVTSLGIPGIMKTAAIDSIKIVFQEL
ncbi:10847_t:CDS:2 [Ambispora leptoticha]|uniref:10847_t:CDS:1 n=1 Tax=Ambispora leptoticha TaxID=144679 RepID=A0A9N9DC06_9GLOM|nr:10847_t:CDS:2 [Ambispora leptoticha]